MPSLSTTTLNLAAYPVKETHNKSSWTAQGTESVKCASEISQGDFLHLQRHATFVYVDTSLCRGILCSGSEVP